jgi:pyridoxine 5-phosphate synthase
VAELQGLGCRVSLFADYDGAIAQAAEIGADRVELYTEPYARAFAKPAPAQAGGDASAALARFAASARAAHAAGLGVNAGHDLSLDNLSPFVAAVPRLLEVSIGHALTADALWLGLDAAVRAYQHALADAVPA